MSFTRTTPITAILAESAEWPIEYMQEFTNIKFICKHIFNNTQFGSDIINNSSTRNLNTTFNKYPLFKLLPSKIIVRNQPININVSDYITQYSKENDAKYNKILTLNEIKINSSKQAVYTDASILDDKVGIGIYIDDTKEEIKYALKHLVSIKCAETFAMFVAIKFMLSMGKKDIIVYTDSKSSCTSLKNAIKLKNSRYYECKIVQLMNKYAESRVTVQWIPAHIGIAGNEMADTLARSAHNEIGNQIEIKIPPDDFINIVKNMLLSQWREEFVSRTQTKGKYHANIIHSTPKLRTWFHKSSLTVKQIKIMNRIRTGHTYDKKFKHLMKIVEDNICETCNTVEDTAHIIENCTKHNTHRQIYTHINTKGLTKILQDGNEKEYLEVLNLIDKIEASV